MDSIIAVTGLAGNAIGSWRDRESKKIWLREFLPNDIGAPVRIMTYGYNTALTGGTDRVDGIHALANALLEVIVQAREKVGFIPRHATTVHD